MSCQEPCSALPVLTGAGGEVRGLSYSRGTDFLSERPRKNNSGSGTRQVCNPCLSRIISEL